MENMGNDKANELVFETIASRGLEVSRVNRLTGMESHQET